jgi:L-fuculose-phosphate aldolase
MKDLQRKYGAEIEELVEASCRLGELGYVASHGGNLSYKVDDDVILITPTKVVKRKMTFNDIVAVRADGSTLAVTPGRKPTGETPVHTRIYRQRPDINALVHAHPPVLTGFSMTENNILARPILPEMILEVGPILRVAYAEPISEALAAEFDAVVARSNAWLMKSHGVMIAGSEGVGRTLELLVMTEAMAAGVAAGLTAGKIDEIQAKDIEDLEKTMSTRNLPRPGDPRVIKKLTDLY